MKTVGIKEAATFLKCHPDTVKKYVRSGLLNGRKIGRAWVFLSEDLVSLIRSGNNGQCLPMPCEKESASWHYTKEMARSGLISQRQTEKELDALLAQTTERKRKSSLTN